MTNLSSICLKDNTQKLYKKYALHVFGILSKIKNINEIKRKITYLVHELKIYSFCLWHHLWQKFFVSIWKNGECDGQKNLWMQGMFKEIINERV